VVAHLFEPDGAGFVAAQHTAGPWDEAMMHGGAPAALLAHAIEQTEPGSELAVTRLTVEFLSAVPIGPVAVETRLAKPGRQFQVVEASLQAGERRVCLARAVRLRRADLPDAAAAPAGYGGPRLAPPQEGEVIEPLMRPEKTAFYPDATEIRAVGGTRASGHAVAWIRLRADLLPGVTPSPLARAMAAADFANGLSAILPFEDWVFVNTELSVHLHRQPAGEWIGLDARTVSDRSGAALAHGVLHDLEGPFGICAESLFVQPRG
jgi:acyl-coenzyme A thioesterase PaaI-like protein